MSLEDIKGKPAILNSHDSYVRSLAESGYQIEKDAREYFEKVETYIRESAAEIWERSGATDDTRIVTARDYLSKYVKLRFTELFHELWSIHPYYPDYLKGTFDTDQITISIEKKPGQLVFSAEDDNGLGVIFNGLQPIAYGPRKFAQTAESLNHTYKEREKSQLITSSQALLLLATESKRLEFKPE